MTRTKAGTLRGMRDSQYFRQGGFVAVLSVVLSGMGWAQILAPSTSPQTEKVYRLGVGITSPKPTKRVDPEFSEEAKRDKVQGIVILSLVVGVDGIPRDITVKRSLGHGLDEKAMEAVKQWIFEPGRKDGQPVPVRVMMEVSFKLYSNQK